MTNDFVVQTGEFQGPLELLLELVEKRKMHITDVALSKVADDFIKYLEELRPFPAESASHFLVVASTLILIKSKALLPYLDLSSEEEEDIEELELRLKIYKTIKEISSEISQLYGKNIIFPTSPPPKEVRFLPGKELNLKNLSDSIERVVEVLHIPDSKPEKQVKKVISLEEMIGRLEKRIKSAISLSFDEFSKKETGEEDSRTQKIEVVVSFLALLELVKQGIMEARQEGRFGEIKMESQQLSTPKYGIDSN